jgi:hypothetical protein
VEWDILRQPLKVYPQTKNNEILDKKRSRNKFFCSEKNVILNVTTTRDFFPSLQVPECINPKNREYAIIAVRLDQ